MAVEHEDIAAHLTACLGLEVEVGELGPDVQGFLNLVVDVAVGEAFRGRVSADLVSDGLHSPSAT